MKEENKKPKEAKEEKNIGTADGPGNEQPKADSKNAPPKEGPMREIIIHTDGNIVKVVKMESTNLEMRSLLSLLLRGMDQPKQ